MAVLRALGKAERGTKVWKWAGNGRVRTLLEGIAARSILHNLCGERGEEVQGVVGMVDF
jgi:hypothetical protein